MVQFQHILTRASRACAPWFWLALMVLSACVDPTSQRVDKAMGNHAGDWRDEIIYQLFVDRFANGDVNNDFNVNPYAPAG